MQYSVISNARAKLTAYAIVQVDPFAMDHQIASNNDQAEEENGRESIFLTPEVVSNHNNDTESAQHVREHLQPSPVRDDDVSRQSLESNGNFSVSETVEEIVEDSNSMSVPPSTYSESNDIPDNESENGKANKDVNDEEEEDDEDDDEDEDEEEDEEEESLILDSRLRRRKSPDRRGAAKELNERRGLVRNISRILKKDDINEAEETLLAQHPELVKETKKRHHRQKKLDERKLEVEDSPEVLTKKCLQLAKAIQVSNLNSDPIEFNFSCFLEIQKFGGLHRSRYQHSCQHSRLSRSQWGLDPA